VAEGRLRGREIRIAQAPHPDGERERSVTERFVDLSDNHVTDFNLLRRAASGIVILLLLPASFSHSARGEDDPQAARDELIVQTVLRLEEFDLASSEKAKQAVLRYLDRHRGSEQYFKLIRRFEIRDKAGELLAVALENPDANEGVQAAEILLELGEQQLFGKVLRGEDPKKAMAAAKVLGLAGSQGARGLLEPLVTDTSVPLGVRSEAVRAIGRNRDGERFLLSLVEQGKLPEDLNFSAANVLLASADAMIRAAAGKHLSLPVTAGKEPLPPLPELVKRSGDAAEGRKLFFKKATCAKCHKVRGEGKEVGPDLSEIGSKLSKQAMLVSILDPSAGVSHNYETYAVATDSGNVLTGILISQTADTVTLRTAEAIDKTVPREEIEEMVKQKISLMPADLQKVLTAEELLDVVAYLQTLKKPK